MSLVHLNFESQYLHSSTDVSIILPDRPRRLEAKKFYMNETKYRVLWLLHGTFGDYQDWIRKTKIDLYASERNLVVVLPSGLNADYANWEKFGFGFDMFKYLINELMPLVKSWFPVSDKKEDHFIGGLSMGALGACQYAFNFPELFQGIIALSGCPINLEEEPLDGGSLMAGRAENQVLNAGGMKKYLKSYQNIWSIAEKKKNELPHMYFACGTDDAIMFNAYHKWKKYAKNLKLNAEFHEEKGYGHEWRFWDLQIEKALDTFGITRVLENDIDKAKVQEKN